MSNPNKPTIALLIASATAFVLILIQYAWYGVNPLSSRIHFAVLMSVAPALPVWAVAQCARLTPIKAVLIYTVLFLLLWLGWALFHG